MSEHISRKELKQDKIHDAIEHSAEAFYLHKQFTLFVLLVVLAGFGDAGHRHEGLQWPHRRDS